MAPCTRASRTRTSRRVSDHHSSLGATLSIDQLIPRSNRALSDGIDNPTSAIITLAQSAMRKEVGALKLTRPPKPNPNRDPKPYHGTPNRKQVGELELDELFLEREKLNGGIASALDEATKPWGIRVFRYGRSWVIDLADTRARG